MAISKTINGQTVFIPDVGDVAPDWGINQKATTVAIIDFLNLTSEQGISEYASISADRTVTTSNSRNQVVVPTTMGLSIILPSIGLVSNEIWSILNADVSNSLTVKSFNGNILTIIVPGGFARCYVKNNPPVASTDWIVVRQDPYISQTPAISSPSMDVTLTAGDSRFQNMNPSVDIVVTLPSSSISPGDIWTILNSSLSKKITVKASDTSTRIIVIPKSFTKLMATVGTPTTSGNWRGIDGGGGWSTSSTNSGDFNQFGAVTVNNSFTRRVGHNLEWYFNFITGAVGGGDPTITLPYGLNIDNNYVVDHQYEFGTVFVPSNSTSNAVYGASVGYVAFYNGTNTVIQTTPSTKTYNFEDVAANSQFATGQTVIGQITIPIKNWEIG